MGILSLAALLCTGLFAGSEAAAPYYGTKIGSFRNYFHDVVGDLYAVDDRTVFIKGFSYDGEGPDAYFWGGTTQKPDTSGFIIPDEKGKKTPLKEYRSKDVLIRLPPGKTLRNIKWLAVWCRKFSANFGEIFIPEKLQIPQPVEIGRIPTKEHGVSSGPVMVVDSQTLLVPEFTYDGLGPAAYWWVSRGSKQHPRGLRLADENGSFSPLPKHTGKTVVITMPDDKTIYDYDWFGVWCEEARVDFGSVALPQNIVVPPSPRMLGIELEYKLNCEVLRDDLGFEVRWIMDGEDIVMQLVGRLEIGEYMSFGLSKNDSKSEMINADAIVAWLDSRKKGHAVDYFLASKEQCVGQRGSCPDTKFPDGQNSVTLLNAAMVNGYTMITVKRPQVGLDEKYDQHVYSDGPQAVVWAVGPLNDRNEVSYHGILRSEGDIFIDFARPPQWNCPQPADPDSPPPTTTTLATTTTRKPTKKPATVDRSRKPKPTSATIRRKPQPIGPRYSSRASDIRLSASTVNTAWNIPPIMCPSDRTFRAQIGPTGGKKGYQSITGEVGWGIAWYINGALIPEITVERGKTYTFIVEGGQDAENAARQHPLYITDDPEGGFEHKTAAEKKKAKLYGGVSKDRRGNYSPSAMGRLCEWKLPKDMTADDFETFEEFQESLELKCERGKPARFTFTPDRDTPDLLYYQCYTHRYLGWKIHVVDSCSETRGLHREASIQHVNNVTYNTYETDASEYKRGGDKKLSLMKDTESAEDEHRPSGNDGIPLNLYESKPQPGNHHFTTTGKPSPKHLYYRTTSRSPQTKNDYYYASTWNKPSTDSAKEYYYHSTAPTQKELYYKHSTFSSTTPRPTYHRNYKVTGPTMESFHIRDVINMNGQSNGNHFQYQPTDPKATVKQTSNVKTIILKSSQPSAVRVRVYQSTKVPQSVRPTQYPSSGTTRSKNAWWNPPGNQAQYSHAGRNGAIQSLRSQLAVVQSTKKEPIASVEAPTNPRNPFSYGSSFIPVVIKHNSTFDQAVGRAPNHNGNLHSQQGSPLGHTLASSHSGFGPNGKNTVPVLIRSRQSVRRTTGQTNKNGILTPLGRLPYPNTAAKKKNSASSSKQPSEAFLPLLVPAKQQGNQSATRGKVNKKQSSAPLIPLVVPEKKDDNLYILHKVFSLLNENPQGIPARGVRIVTGEKTEKNIRPRVVRSADHHHKHTSSHAHEDHDHNHEGHESHHKDSSQKSGSNSLYMMSLYPILMFCAVRFLKELTL